ncbi:NAD(P)H-hydrate dehydratase [Orenia marismortui]|uniref:Bifunctional NAD(P)H-hydrate repair enzyme n=1 Tax=Orenia marismortui TaxID=46469 RepID=A0A4R8GXK1_9FIRM|nr:NAD(P)H-hydrate dehydratase [Orenia marismortui]TDX50947.1 NAD(P)H-hydrate epimerase [Orenia marismortui]
MKIKLVTADQMKEIDRYSIEEIGIPGIVLMERAALEVKKVAEDYLSDLKKSKVIVLVGTGNNGGDGLAVARMLQEAGYNVEVFIVGEKVKVTDDAKVNLNILEKLKIEVKEIVMVEELLDLKTRLDSSDLIIDALLGTGIKGKLRGIYPEVISIVNKSNLPVISIDIPSGVEADTGRVEDIAIQAKETITFALPKLGTILYPGAEYVGKLKIVDIGIPHQVIKQQNIDISLITDKLINDLLPTREKDSHKGTYGRLLLVAGSTGMTGAATLSAQASLKIGAGLVTVAIPKSLNSILENKLTEAMTYPLSETEFGTLAIAALEEIEKLIDNRDVLAIGPGLTARDEIDYIVTSLLKKTDKTLVIDADGLNVINNLEILKEREGSTILTPHPGEMSRLVNKSIKYIKKNSIKIAKEFSQEYGVVLLLKGARTIIATPKGNIYINPTGNSGMATGGSGDVLTGLIAGLLAQKNVDVRAATIIATYLHGLAGDLAVEDLTEYSLLPSNLIDYLPQALKVVTSDK